VDPKLYAAGFPVRSILPESLPQIRNTQKLFDRLCRSVVGQQLATKAASSIWAKVVETCGGKVTAEKLLSTSLLKLRAAGLSGAKVKTLQSISAAVQNKSLKLLALKRMPEPEAIAMLTAVWGIGTWTAEMFLMFALGRPDVFSIGDLGLVRSIERIYRLPKNSPKEKLLKTSKAWTPYQTYASLILWRSHDATKK